MDKQVHIIVLSGNLRIVIYITHSSRIDGVMVKKRGASHPHILLYSIHTLRDSHYYFLLIITFVKGKKQTPKDLCINKSGVTSL